MRIIGGELRGKKLSSPKDESVRPTTDRVKESMFNLIAGEIGEDTVVYDLFSGSGGLGIEALSRGARKAFFCDRSRNSYDLTLGYDLVRTSEVLPDATISDIIGDRERSFSYDPDEISMLIEDIPGGSSVSVSRSI